MNVTIYPGSQPGGINFDEASVVRNISGGTVEYSDTADPFVAEGTLAVGATVTLHGSYFFEAAETTLLSHVPVLTGTTDERVEELALRMDLLEGVVVTLDPPSGSAATDTANLVAAGAACLAAGGGTIVAEPAPASAPYRLNAAVEIASLVNLVGAGVDATVFLLTTAAARLNFVTGAGGMSGGFTVNGGTVTVPVAEVGIEIGIVNHRSFRDIKIQFTLNDGLLLVGTQNCTFDNVQSYWHFGNCISVTNSAGANHFINCGAGRTKAYIISIRQTASDPGIGSAQPLGNTFWGGVFEYTSNGADPALGVVQQTAGVNTGFIGCQLVRGTDAPGASVFNLSKQATFGVTVSTAICINTISLISDYTGHHFLIGAGAKLHIGGTSFAPTGGASIFSLSTTSFVETDAFINPAAVGSPLGTLIDPGCAAAAVDAWTALVRHKRNVVHEITLPDATIASVAHYVTGEGQPRWSLRGDGLWAGSGSGFIDTQLKRVQEGVWGGLKGLQFVAVAAASVPNNTLFLDSADNVLKQKNNAGVVSAL